MVKFGKNGEKMNYGYARVSTQCQARDGNSLEAQKTALTVAGATEIFSDAFTGTKTDRPELNKLLETGYMTASVYAAIAYVAWEQQDTERCMSYYEQSLQKDPDNVSSLNGLGYVLACQEKDLSRALSLCKQAVKTAPKSAACLDSLGWVYYKLGLYKDALQYLQQAEQLDTTNVEIADHIKSVRLKAGH